MGMQKEITCRMELALWEELHEEAHKRRVSKNQAVIQALTLWLKKAPPAQQHGEAGSSKVAPIVAQEIAAQLATLLSGQALLQDGLRQVLESQRPISKDQHAQVADPAGTPVPPDIAAATPKLDPGQKLPPAPKTNRSRKFRFDSDTGTEGSGH